jgi:aminopeptidase N
MKKVKLLITILLFPFFTLAQEVETKTDRYHAENYYPQVEKDRLVLNKQMNQYDIKHYFLDIEVSPLNTSVSGFAEMMAKSVNSELDTIVLELNDALTVDSIMVDGQSVSDYSHQDDQIRIILTNPVNQGSYFKTRVYYHGISSGGGLSHAYNSTYGSNVSWTLSESFHAKDWWPSKQVLADKADSATIFLTTNEEYTAVSNGLLQEEENLGNGKVKYKWKTYYPINYYLISFAVANYHEYSFYAYPEGLNDSVFIQNFVYSPYYVENNKTAIENTRDFLELFSDLYGLYPFYNEKYGHSLTELGGGMEHQTITTTGGFSFNLISHELMHQWFGDYVTCATWQDIWINEGFASYGEYVAQQYICNQASADSWMSNAHSIAKSIPNGSVYIPFEDANNEARIFNYYLSYKKGASLVHMIRYLIDNDNLFFQSMENFLQEYSDSVATGEDLKNSISGFTGINFDSFFDEWYYGKGFPKYDVAWEKKNNEQMIYFSQETSANDGMIFTIPVELLLTSDNGADTLITIQPSAANEEFTIDWEYDISDITIDPENWILNGEKNLISVGIKEKQSFNVEVYPNPVINNLHVKIINGNNSPVRYHIFDISGKLVEKGVFTSDKNSISTENWSKGLFFLEIIQNKSHLYKKIIRQ